MKPHEPEAFNRPFAGLNNLLRQKSIGPEPAAPAPRPALPPPVRAACDDEVFAAAMAGVVRMELETLDAGCPAPRSSSAKTKALREENGVGRLQQLVDDGTGFLVCDTPEYMEGVGYRAPPDITERLHRGDFAVQAHIDLHGLTAEAAEEVFDAFMKESIRTGKGAVLIIHGRGLSSPGEPVLKTRCRNGSAPGTGASGSWPSPAPACATAAAGASYVLLRRRPLTKRHRTRRRRQLRPAN